ncbi:MAG TPA: N-ethylammeline chlorohydrolase, partial [Clostridiales bacterium]|nr:N-ethylammeline chlorohydrolase [Clostridiales bacterium]
MGGILIRDIDIITADPQDGFRACSDIGIEGNRFLYIRPSGERENTCREFPAFQPDHILSGKGRLAIPGLVNAHTHTGMTLFRNLGNDLPLQSWLFDRIFPAEAKMTGDEVYWGTLLGIGEMIRSGSTACADMYLWMDHAVKAYAESGFRVNMAPGPYRFVASPAPRLVDETGWFADFYRHWNDSCGGRIKVYVQAHSVYLLDREHL